MSPRLLAVIILLAAAPAIAGEFYSKWDRESIVKIAAEYIETTKIDFAVRAAEILDQTGEIVPLDFQYFHLPTGSEAKRHQKFLDSRLSDKKTQAHIHGFLEDFERIRANLATAEARAAKSWEAEHADDTPKTKETKHFDLFGEEVAAKYLGVLLDNSPSMLPHLEALRAEIAAVFPEYIPHEVWGSFLSYRPEPRHHSALRALAELEKADAIYWFCDFDDEIDDRAIAELERIISATGIKLYVHTLKRSPPNALRTLIEETGGAIIRKKIR